MRKIDKIIGEIERIEGAKLYEDGEDAYYVELIIINNETINAVKDILAKYSIEIMDEYEYELSPYLSYCISFSFIDD